MAQCTVKTRHVPGSKAERECEVHGVGMRPRSAVAAALPPPGETGESKVNVLHYPDGTVEAEWWYLAGKLHRVDGPAGAGYHPDGTVEWERWWLDGKQAPRERVAAVYLTKHFEPVSETNTGAIDMLLAQGPLTSLTAEQVRLALTLYPEI